MRRSPPFPLLAAALTLCATGACSSGSNPGVPSGPFVEARHAPLPLIPYFKGGIVAAPAIVTVTFPGDPLESELQAFGAGIEGTQWWSTVVAGYCAGKGGPCVHAGAPAKSVVYPTAAGAHYTDSTRNGPSTLKTWIEQAVTRGALPPPAAGAVGSISDTIYLLYFPASTEIVLDGAGGCANLEGYHAAITLNGQDVTYAVISECPGKNMGNPPPTTLQGTTLTASHELVEAATDPSDSANITTSYYLDLSDPTTFGWNDIAGGEIADLCLDQFGFDQDEYREGAFTYQRIWSTSQAAAGLDPCAPVTSTAYFNAAPERSFFVLDVGETIQFEVDAFSVAARADWTLAVEDWTVSTNPFLSFSITGGTKNTILGADIIQVNNGSKVEVTMTLLRDPISTQGGEADGSVLSFTGDLTGPPAAYWAFSVMTPSDARSFGVDASLTPSGRTPPRRHTRRHNPMRSRSF